MRLPTSSSGSWIVCITLLACRLAGPAAAQTSLNDSENNPQMVGFGSGVPFSFAYDNSRATTGATHQGNGACVFSGTPGIENDQWYLWQAASTGTATLTACGASGGDTKVAVYYQNGSEYLGPAMSGPNDSDLIACNDDACGLRSQISFYVAPGNIYFFQIGKYPGSPNTAGSFTLTPPPLPHGGDDCSAATPVTGLLLALGFNNFTATTGPQGQDNQACLAFGRTGIENDEWYLWTPWSSGIALLTACNGIGGANSDTKVAVYDGAACPGPNSAIACNDDSCGVVSQLNFQAVCGHQYLIQIGKYPGSAGGIGQFVLQVGSSGCACPRLVTGTSATLPFNFAESPTTDWGLHGCDMSQIVTRPTWYRWVATGNGLATISSCGLTTTDTIVLVLGGCPVNDPHYGPQNCLASDDNGCGLQSQVSFWATWGTEYIIEIGGTFGAGRWGAGTFSLVGPFRRRFFTGSPADWNQDGRTNTQDFFDFLTAFMGNDADFNDDGVTDSLDLFGFVDAFFNS